MIIPGIKTPGDFFDVFYIEILTEMCYNISVLSYFCPCEQIIGFYPVAADSGKGQE